VLSADGGMEGGEVRLEEMREKKRIVTA